MREEILLDVIVLLVAGLLLTVVILRAFSEARREIVAGQLTIIANQENQMAEIDDLKQAVLDETAAITEGNTTDARLLADIEAAIAKLTTPGINPADVATAAQAIKDATATLKANNAANATAATNIEAALNPTA